MRQAVLAAALLAVTMLPAQSARAETHENEKLGFKISVPRKWTTLPIATDSQWVVAKFACNRQLEFGDPKTGGWAFLRPEIEVVVIPHAVRDRGAAKVKKTDKGVEITREAPWKTIKEYVDKTSRNIGGFHFSAEEEDEVDGVKVTKYELTVDKLVTGERRVFAWAFEGEDAEWGLVCQLFERDVKKMRSDVFRSFRSFRLFARTGSLPNESVTGESITIEDTDTPDGGGKDPETTAREREAAVDRLIEKIKESLAKGWSIKESKHFIAVTHTDRKFTGDVLEHCEAVRKWLDESLSWIGDGHVGRVVVRICDGDTEYNAYRESRGWFSDAPEIVTYKDQNGWDGDWIYHSLNSQLWDTWIKDRNDTMRWGAPQWFDSGIGSLIQDARSKRKKVVFRPWEGDKAELKKAMKEDRLLNVEQFFSMTSEDIWSDWRAMSVQARYFVDFLLNGRAARSKRFQAVLPVYFETLTQVLAEEEAKSKEESGEAGKAPTSEEEEDQMYRDRQQAWRKKEKEQLQSVYDRVFAGWTEKDWRALDRMYRKGLD